MTQSQQAFVADSPITDVNSALDLLANASYQGAQKVVLMQAQLPPTFFDLRSGLAGEILQKSANYQMPMEIHGDFESIASKAFQAFLIECNRTGHLIFVQQPKDNP